MSKVLKEVSTIVGEYRNAAGETKKRYLRIGSIIETKSGPMLKIDAVPMVEGGWDGWAYLNTPRVTGEEKPAKAASKNSGFDDLEDTPF